MTSHASRQPAAGRRAFSVVELFLTTTVMLLLVGVVSTRASDVTDEARSAAIVELTEGLEGAVEAYHEDTGELPREYSGYQGSTFHRLSKDPGVVGWAGPYVEAPIDRSWNPAGGQVHLYSSARHAVGEDYDLNGDGAMDVAREDACSISFFGVGEGLARRVDAALDGEVPSRDWRDSGRVEFRPAEHLLSVMVHRR
ncbi:MAG: hypothetical protein VX460_01620 [Planctomycetota bacterium]|nr:hypothetical protein [Planctomycetota bacterium]